MSEKRTNMQMFFYCLKYSALDVMTLGMYSGFRNIRLIEENNKKQEEERDKRSKEFEIRMLKRRIEYLERR